MSQQFSFDSKYKRSVIIMAIVGVFLALAGFMLSNVSPGGHGEGHGSGHEQAAPSGGHTESHGGHGFDSIPPIPGDSQNLTSVTPADSDSTHLAAAPHEVASHDDAGHHEGKNLTPWVKENAPHKIYRAPFHAGQETLPVKEHHSPGIMSKLGAALLIGVYGWMGISLFGILFIAIGYVANAGWYIAFKRVVETYYRYLIVGGAVMVLISLVFLSSVYHHWAVPYEELDEILKQKAGFLNLYWYLGTVVVFFAGWLFFGHRFRKYSLDEEKVGGLENHQKSYKNAAMFLPFFGVSFCLSAFLWLMSIDPHWYSTIYAVNVFAGVFVGGFATTIFITTNLKEKGYLAEVSADHIHDLGKFMFAMSIFWAYTWVSQYLLIWYANISEEGLYYTMRFENFKVLFFLNLAVNFILPFFALMTRNAKRVNSSARSIAVIILAGRFLDLFLLVVPGVLGADWNVGVLVMALGFYLVFGATFFYFVYSGMNGVNLSAEKHPYFEESVHHETGI